MALMVGIEQGEEACQGLVQDFAGQSLEQGGPAGAPVEALDLVREQAASDGESSGKRHLERISLDLRGDGTDERQPHAGVIEARGEDESGSPPCLLVAQPWIEVQPDCLTP